MDWLYKLLGFKKYLIIGKDKYYAYIEHQDNDDFTIPIGLIKGKKEADYIILK